MWYKGSTTLINLENVKFIELKENKINFVYNENSRSEVVMVNEFKAKEEFERISKKL